MGRYLVRAQLVDRPGALGALAGALGACGGDIASIEVIGRDPSVVVDDLVVDIVDERLPDLLAAADAVPGVSVVGARRYDGTVELGHELDMLDTVYGSGGIAQVLVARVARTAFKADWAVLVEGTADGSAVAGHGSAGAPRMRWSRLPWLPLTSPSALSLDGDWVPDSWQHAQTALAAAPVGRTRRALLVGRDGGPAFHPAEVGRLGRLAALAAAVADAEEERAPSRPRGRVG